MQSKTSGEFETALARLEAIVKQLETEEVELDRSVDLFKEGKALARKCEELLRTAQGAIEAATSAGGPPTEERLL